MAAGLGVSIGTYLTTTKEVLAIAVAACTLIYMIYQTDIARMKRKDAKEKKLNDKK